MTIKLYSSQLTPTTETSNVLDKRQISLDEAASIGKAWKGMVQSGEKLYAKHLDIKSDKELLETSKVIMNGKTDDNGNVISTGLSEVLIKAKDMDDPDKAIAYYNNTWKSLLETEKSNLSWMAKRKFTSWMNKQNLKDTNSIKQYTTVNMINGLRNDTLDKIETLKKSIIWSTGLEQETSKSELAELLSNDKTKELFGVKLDEVIKQTNNEIAFFQYKNVAIADQEAALLAAEKDDRIPNDGTYSLNALRKHFKSAKSTSNYLNKDNVSKMENNIKNNIPINTDEFEAAVRIAQENGDQATLIKLENIKNDAPIYAMLSTLNVSQIEERINILTEYKNTNRDGMELKYARNLEISKKYLANLTSSLNKSVLVTANDNGVIAIQDINFEDMMMTGDVEKLQNSIKERIAKSKTAAFFYNRPVEFFTPNEVKAIESAFQSANTASDIIGLSTILVEAFGNDSDIAFRQFSKDNTFLSTIGGLTIMNDGVPGKNVLLAAEGYLISKKPELAKTYLMKSSDKDLFESINLYAPAFNLNVIDGNKDTFNNIIEMANYIYAAKLKNEGKSVENFDAADWQEAFIQAAGGSEVKNFPFNKEFGGFDEDTKGNMVHIPPWMPRGDFEKVIERFNKDIDGRKLFKKASSNGELPVLNGKTINVSEIFFEQDPYFVSVGNGRYRIAMGENPNEFGAEPEFLLNSDGGVFIININQIRDEIITGLN